MAKKIHFDINNNIEPFTIILSTREYTHLGKIHNADLENLICKQNLNAVNEISFTVYYELDNYIEPLWDKIANFMLVYVKDLNEYYQIVIDKDHSDDLHKEVHGFSLCEAELGQTMLYGIEINNENDYATMTKTKSDGKNNTIFYDFENPDFSLLHRILKKAPHYTIKHVDGSLAHEQRSFSVSGKSIYDFLVKDCAEQFNCIFLFDSTDRSISVYDLYTVCQNDDCSYYQTEGRHYRGPFNDFCPKCGSTNLYYFGSDTHIFVDRDNLTKDIKLTTDTDSIKNTFRLEAGDENMNAVIRNNNPNGSNEITYFSPEMKALLPDDLVQRLEEYDELYDSYRDQYSENAQDLYEQIDEIYYLEHSMMPQRTVTETDATKEVQKLVTEFGKTAVSIDGLSSHTTKSSVDNAVLGYAKVIVRGGFYKVEIKDSEYTFNGSTGVWSGKFTVTSYTNNKDTITPDGDIIPKDAAESDTINITINSDYEEYLEQKIYKQIVSDETRATDKTLYEVVTISDINQFRYTIHGNGLSKDDPDYVPGYNLTSLKSFLDAVQSAMEIMVTMGHGKPEKENETAVEKLYDFYWKIYEPLNQKKEALVNEIAVRDGQISYATTLKESYEDIRTNIQKALNFKDFLGEDLYLKYCAYRREDTYQNQNFITTEIMTTPDVFNKVNDYLEQANKEIIKAGTPQHTLDANIYNLLVMKEFTAIVDEFELGNWIRVRIDDQIYRLRLIGYEINFKDLSVLNTQFSNLTITADGYNDVMSILNQSKSMASSYSNVQQQAKKGNEADGTLYNFRQQGLDTALYYIKNSNSEQVLIDNHGVSSGSYDDISDSLSDEQVRLNGKILAFTNDNWKTVKSAFGKLQYRLNGTNYEDYGLNVDTVVGARIISADIYSGNYSTSSPQGTHIDLMTGDFSFAGGKINYDATNNILVFGQNDNSITYNGGTGKLVFGSGVTLSYENVDGLDDELDSLESDISTAQSTANSAASTASSASTATSNLRTAVQGALTKGTTITANSVISPKIAGGYLYIASNNYAIEIDPQGERTQNAPLISATRLSDGAQIFGIDKNGNAYFTGNISGSTITGSTLETENGIKIGDSYIRFNTDMNILEWKDEDDPDHLYTTMLQTIKDTSTSWNPTVITKICDGVITYTAASRYEYTSSTQKSMTFNSAWGGDFYFYFKRNVNFQAPVSINGNNLDIINGSLNATNVYATGEIKINGSAVALKSDIPSTSNFVTTTSINNATLNGNFNSLKVNGTSVLTSHQSLSDYYTKTQIDNKGYLTSVSNSDLPNSSNKDLSGSNYVRAVGLYVGTSSSYRCIKHVSSRIAFQDSAGNYTDIAMNDCYANSSSSYKSRSSKYIKKNINNITDSDALNILNLRPVEFDYIDNNKHDYGFIAEETEKYLPQLVYTPDNYDEEKVKNGDLSNVKGISYLSFIPYIIKLCQIQQDEIDLLKAQIKDLKGE